MKTTHRIVFVMLFAICVFTATSYPADYIRVGSFNIANFGASENGEYERSLVSLVNMILEMDAMQSPGYGKRSMQDAWGKEHRPTHT